MKRKFSRKKHFFICLCLSTAYCSQDIHAFVDDGSWKPEGYWGLKGVYAPTATAACSAAGYNSGWYKILKGHPSPTPYWYYCWVEPPHTATNLHFHGNGCLSTNPLPPEDAQCGTLPTPIVINESKARGTPIGCTTGNPISISTGNKFQQEVILNRPLPLTLSYNSLDQQWRHSYAYSLDISDSTATLVRPDGKGLGFTQTDNVWAADDGDVFYTLFEFDNGSGSAWKITTQSGAAELYDDQGRILSITNLQGQSLSFTHTDTSTEVSDEFGNVLSLTLDTNDRLTSADLNGNNQATFTYDNEARLVSRTDAQNNTVQYHYEDTRFHNHLTGITGADGQRFATWAYNAEGRGILSEHAAQETAQLAFNADGSTTVTNSLGKQTTYHYEEIQGLKRPVQIEGHASDNCIAANQAYTYNAEGLVETQTDWSGNITRFEYNDRGLVTRKTVAEGTAQERVTEQVWHESLPLLLQTQSAGRITQYQYDTENRLINTEELSVPSP